MVKHIVKDDMTSMCGNNDTHRSIIHIGEYMITGPIMNIEDVCQKCVDELPPISKETLQNEFGFVEGETRCSKCEGLLTREDCHWSFGKWWHLKNESCEERMSGDIEEDQIEAIVAEIVAASEEEIAISGRIKIIFELGSMAINCPDSMPNTAKALLEAVKRLDITDAEVE